MLKNGIDREVPFSARRILYEASQDGDTSLVYCNSPDVSISQHESGDWDISVNGEAYNEYEENDGKAAVQEFMSLVKRC